MPCILFTSSVEASLTSSSYLGSVHTSRPQLTVLPLGHTRHLQPHPKRRAQAEPGLWPRVVVLTSLSFTISQSTHVHWVDDAIEPSHPLLPPSLPALNLSQHQSLFQWVDSSTSGDQSIRGSASASVFPINIQGWSPLGWTGWISFQSKGLSRVFSSTTVQWKSLIFWVWILSQASF